MIWYFYKHHITQSSPARAVICPHAGYRYSGPTAAYSFRQIDPRLGVLIIIYFDPIVCRVVKTIFVLGPSHHVRLSGCAVTQHVAYQTPLYDLRWRVSNVNLGDHLFYSSINTEISQELLNTGHFEIMTVEADEDEHSIEMQLPYIAKVGEESPNSISWTINVSFRWWSLQEESSTLSLWWWVIVNL